MPAAGRVLTARELNRALLARQLLLERARTPIARTLERMGGLQAQYAPSMYIGLWSRMEGFERDDLTRALERRSVVQATLMRATIHLVSRADYWPFEIGVKRARADWTRRVATYGAPPAKLRAAASKLRRALDGGSLQRKEIEELLGKEMARGVGMELDLVRVPPAGTWERRRADLYAAAEDWLGPPPGGLTEEAGIELLVRRYLGAFGPSTRVEVADWAGLPVALVEPPLERIATRRFRAEDGAELVDLPRARCRTRTRRRRCASCRPGTRRCSPTRAAAASCPRSTGRGSSTPRCRSRSGPSSWTDRSPAPGSSTAAASAPSRSRSWTAGRAASSTPRPSAWPTSTDRLRR